MREILKLFLVWKKSNKRNFHFETFEKARTSLKLQKLVFETKTSQRKEFKNCSKLEFFGFEFF